MEIQDGAVNIVEELRVVLDRVATAEEDNNLLLLGLHPSQKRKEQDESLVGVAEHIALFKAIHRAELLLFVDIDIKRSGSQRYPGEII